MTCMFACALLISMWLYTKGLFLYEFYLFIETMAVGVTVKSLCLVMVLVMELFFLQSSSCLRFDSVFGILPVDFGTVYWFEELG